MSAGVVPPSSRPSTGYREPVLRTRETNQPVSWMTAEPDDSIETLELSVRAHGALVRVGASKVRDLLGIEARSLSAEPNVGHKTLRELKHLLRVFSDRFAAPDRPPEDVPEPAGESTPWSEVEPDTPVADLEIPTRLARALADLTIVERVRDLLAYDPEVLRALPEVGQKTVWALEDLQQALRRHFDFTTPPGELEGIPAARPTRRVPAAWSEAGKDTPIAALELSARAAGALVLSGASSVRDVLNVELAQLATQRGVGLKTFQELAHLLRVLGERFSEAPAPPGDADRTLGNDTLFDDLLPQGGGATTSLLVVRHFLGLDEGAATNRAWPRQSEVARELGVTRARVGQVITAMRQSWRSMASIGLLRDEIRTILERLGGVATVGELVAAVESRRTDCAVEERRRLAMALTRAAVEAEGTFKAQRFRAYRRRLGVFVALGSKDQGCRLATYANALGQRARELVGRERRPSVRQAVYVLRRVHRPAEVEPLDRERLLQLAVATAGVNEGARSRAGGGDGAWIAATVLTPWGAPQPPRPRAVCKPAAPV